MEFIKETIKMLEKKGDRILKNDATLIIQNCEFRRSWIIESLSNAESLKTLDISIAHLRSEYANGNYDQVIREANELLNNWPNATGI